MMAGAELLTLRSVLVLRRSALIDRMATGSADMVEPGFLRLLADTHTAIAALDAALAESTVTGDES